jgi:hypothetical protein
MAVTPTIGPQSWSSRYTQGTRLPVGGRSHERTLLRSNREKIREPSTLRKGRSPQNSRSQRTLKSRLLPQPGRRIRELTGKCCLASCDFCLKMLSPRSVLLGVLKYSLFNFVIDSLHKSVGSSPTRGAILFIAVQAFTVAALTTSIVPTLVNSKPGQGASLPSRVNWP